LCGSSKAWWRSTTACPPTGRHPGVSETSRSSLDSARAEQAVGILLALVKTQGRRDKVDLLFDKLPGASELAARHGGDGGGGGGGLLARLGGGLMGAPLVAVGKLQALGLSMGEIKTLGAEVLDYAREKAGEDLVRDVAGSIPGLSGFV
jgi:hypothetical protein